MVTFWVCMMSPKTKWGHTYLVLKFRILDHIERAASSMNGVWEVHFLLTTGHFSVCLCISKFLLSCGTNLCLILSADGKEKYCEVRNCSPIVIHPKVIEGTHDNIFLGS